MYVCRSFAVGRVPACALSALALLLAACSGPAPAAQPTAAPAVPAAAANPVAATPASSGAAAPGAAGASVSCAEFASQGSGGASIKMGADGSLTGATASFGTGMKRGIEICLKEFNDAGGYQGRKVEIPFLDDQGPKPEVAVANITRFVQQDKVVAVLGPVNSGNAFAFIPKIEEAEVPLLVPISTSVGVVYTSPDGKPADVYDTSAKPRKWVFRSSMQDNYQVETILSYGKAKSWDALGLMHDTSGYGTASKATADKLIPAGGYKILDTETYNVGDTDMTSQLQKMKAAGVKQIVNFGLGPEDASLLRSAQKIDYQVQFSGAWGFSDPVVPQLAGKDLAEGVVTVASFTPDRSPAATDFHQKMLQNYGEDPFPITAAQAYDGSKMMLQALSKSGPDPAKLRDALENLDGFKGVTGAPSKPFGPDRHHSLEGKDMFAAVWKNGELVRAQ